MLHDKTLRDKMRSCLADAKDLRELISDHKRKLISRIIKGIAGKMAVDPGELKTLIFTRPKVGYMLDVGKNNVVIFSNILDNNSFYT